MSLTPYNTDIRMALKWQQNNAPNITLLINQKAQWYDRFGTQFWKDWTVNVFDIRTVNPFGILIWCIILGVPSQLFGLFSNPHAWAYGKNRQNFIAGPGSTAANPNLIGGNFAGGGQTTILNLQEARWVLRLRYVALVSNGRISFINNMLREIFNDGEPWDRSSGKYMYLMDSTGGGAGGVPTVTALYKHDWRGKSLLYSTPRTNLLFPSSPFNFTDGIWVQSGNDWDLSVVVGPSGSVTARKAVLNKQSLGSVLYNGGAATTIGRTYVASAYVSGVTGTERPTLTHSNSYFDPIRLELSTSYQRFSLTYTQTSNGGYLGFNSDGYQDAGWGLQIDNAQIEELPSLTTDPVGWSAVNAVSVQAATIAAPDGSMTAKNITKTNASGNAFAESTAPNAVVISNGDVYESIIWIAGSSSTKATLGVFSTGAYPWGLDGDTQAQVIFGTGSVTIQSGASAAVLVDGLTVNAWTAVRIRRSNCNVGERLSLIVYPDQSTSLTNGVGNIFWEGRLYVLKAPTPSITTTNTAKTVTDYVQNSASNFTFSPAPELKSTVNWDGTWNGFTVTDALIAEGDGATTTFDLPSKPWTSVPTAGAFTMEYRIGSGMGFSAQFLTLLGDPQYGIAPSNAGTKYTVVLE